jgi:hypothetical protein
VDVLSCNSIDIAELAPRTDRRKEARTDENRPADLSTLDISDALTCRGMIENISGSGLRMTVPRQIAVGTAVKVETKTTLMLGEVIRCDSWEDRFRVAIHLRHCLTDLPGLAAMTAGLMSSAPTR